MPATPSALARAWPCPQPSATTSTTTRAAALLPVVLAAAPAVGPGRARRTFAGSSGTGGAARNGAPSLVADRLGEQPAVGHERRERATRPTRRSRRPRARTAGRACRSRRARPAQPPFQPKAERHRLHFPRPLAVREALVGAEHAIEEARRVRAHQLAAQAVARRPSACAASPRARRRASARRRRDRRGTPRP